MQTINVTEPVSRPVEGIFEFIVRRRDGSIVMQVSEENMIVFLSKTILSHLVGNDTVGYPVTRISFGVNPAAAAPGDNSISGLPLTSIADGFTAVDGTNVAYTKEIAETLFPEYNKVTFNWELGYSEGNGLAITEYGLLTSNRHMFSRKARGIITKDADLAIEGSWTLIF